jgi:hypothetical protein
VCTGKVYACILTLHASCVHTAEPREDAGLGTRCHAMAVHALRASGHRLDVKMEGDDVQGPVPSALHCGAPRLTHIKESVGNRNKKSSMWAVSCAKALRN